MNLYIGLMSGTSMDGIDAAVVDLDTNQLIAGITISYRNKTLKQLNDVLKQKNLPLALIPQLNTLIGQDFAEAVQKLLASAQIPPHAIQAIGSHGQTIAHDVTVNIPYTFQLGCAHTIAVRTGITVIADFRTRDLVLGGIGAPFAPIFHQTLFGLRFQDPIAIVNIGGIANVTFLHQHQVSQGFDTGPGNCLLDYWIQKHLNRSFDANGEWASSGTLAQPLLDSLLSDSYFQKLPPKSVGKEYFSPDWLTKNLTEALKPEDVQATLLSLTALTICNAIKDSPQKPKNVFVCGGGAHNTKLLQEMARNLTTVNVSSTETMGVDPDFIEAMMFAWLAEKTLTKTPVDLRPITGASKPAILGAIYYP
ncbi:anhydro-N-acetylmuramic acid kinase [Legionella impletisoli]|uniref:Anhydro-N-acetylmuramic acid kinase n=1 Tax=Legionella impletisoli TaxID=343510 RepID=A0A917JXT4_9GAMM|nr:anhydro-N-acetylmuramic acid kinase [Legionella impletisoli]GGI91249.1 anhydro-N-acetylmuramic acid kinase [Legionella impletisoli]